MVHKSNLQKTLPDSQVAPRFPAGKIKKTPSDLDLQIRIKNLEEINLVDDSGEKCVTLKRYKIMIIIIYFFMEGGNEEISTIEKSQKFC